MKKQKQRCGIVTNDSSNSDYNDIQIQIITTDNNDNNKKKSNNEESHNRNRIEKNRRVIWRELEQFERSKK